MYHTQASLPNKLHNLTGLYLGLDAKSRPPRSKSAIPPLARGRGVPHRPKTPAEDHSYKLIEYFRSKEESRGFTGSLRKLSKSAVGKKNTDKPQEDFPVSWRKWGPGKLINSSNLDDFLRPNARSFTAVSNSGVTRSEQLISPASNNVQGHGHYTQEELQSLVRCYRKICKGDDVTLYSLLPGRRLQQSTSRHNIGFSVRCYINPNKAEILAEFGSKKRPVPSSSLTFPLVGHYEFGADHQVKKISKTPDMGQDKKDSSLPDISVDCGSRPSSRQPANKITPLSDIGKCLAQEEYTLGATKIKKSESRPQDYEAADKNKAVLRRPLVELPVKEREEEAEEGEERSEDFCPSSEDIMNQVMLSGDTMASNLEVRPRPKLTTSNSGADIMLGLETDDGKSAEVEIDSLETEEFQPEDIPKGRVRKTSIVEKLSKSKQSELIALSLMESAGQRQREFEKLISEHQELVHEISRTPSAENIVQSEAGRDS